MKSRVLPVGAKLVWKRGVLIAIADVRARWSDSSGGKTAKLARVVEKKSNDVSGRKRVAKGADAIGSLFSTSIPQVSIKMSEWAPCDMQRYVVGEMRLRGASFFGDAKKLLSWKVGRISDLPPGIFFLEKC